MIRYTREKLLSLRGVATNDTGPPDCLKMLVGDVDASVILSKMSQDPGKDIVCFVSNGDLKNTCCILLLLLLPPFKSRFCVVAVPLKLNAVCWDSFDADEIWAMAVRAEGGGGGGGGGQRVGGGGGVGGGERRPTTERMMGPKGLSSGGGLGGSGRLLRDFDSGDEGGGGSHHRASIERERGSGGGSGGFGGGRWQRGVALPEGGDTRSNTLHRGGGGRDDSGRSLSNRYNDNYEAKDPDELWDDPTTSSGVGGRGGSGGVSGADSDFSAFGGSLDDEPKSRGRTGMSAFELTDMSKAAAAFESELHGHKKGGDNGSARHVEDDDDDAEEEGGAASQRNVDPSRPLASSGTTIRSGSGDNVNVFEDFGDAPPAVSGGGGAGVEGVEGDDELPIKSVNEENNASSRLMKMIGVAGTGEAAGGAPSSSAISDTTPKPVEVTKSAAENAAAVHSNPWGAMPSSVSVNPWGDTTGGGFGTQPTKEADAVAAAATAQRKLQEEELLRQRLQKQQQEEEEKKQWAVMQAKQQAEMQAARQRQQEQIKQQQNQVELVLIERISNFLETSWGRSDLPSILSALHASDSRVIAILSSVEALRALISRHPQRIQLGRDPTMSAEMAALRLTNAQWQVHQAQLQAQAQQLQAAQEQELQRRRQLLEEQARQQQQQQQAEEMARREAEERMKQERLSLSVVPNAPWFYADPQGNIQGPFSWDEMRQWLEAGYFKSDLPISQSRSGPFRALNLYFTDSKKAFQPITSSIEWRKQTGSRSQCCESPCGSSGQGSCRGRSSGKTSCKGCPLQGQSLKQRRGP